MAFDTGTDSPNYAGGYGYPGPYEEAATQARVRLSTRDRLLAALSGLGQVQPNATFGQAFIQGLGGSARAISASQQAAQNYAQKQIEAEQAKEDRIMNTKYKEAMIKSLEKPEKPPTISDWQRTPEEQAAMIGFEARRAKALAEANPKPAKEPSLVQVAGPDGTTMWVEKSQAVGKPTGAKANAPTEGQSNAATYFDRASASDDAVSSFEKNYTKMGLGQLQQRYLPNAAQSPEQQSYNQAQREFVTAKLRRESGAAISQSEFENEAKTLFAQPGDSQRVLDQKRAARRRVIEGLKRSAGNAIPSGSSRVSNFDPESARKKYGY